MKMAKASTADMEMAMKLCSALEALDRRFFPEGAEGDNDPEDFERDDDAHCGQALRHILDILQGGSVGRVIWGMYVLLDPANKVVDPDASTLEDHPETVSAFEDAERYRWLRDAPATHQDDKGVRQWLWSRPGGAGTIDAAIDAAMAMTANVVGKVRPACGTSSGGRRPERL